MKINNILRFKKKIKANFNETLLLVDDRSGNTASMEEWLAIKKKFNADLINPGLEKKIPKKNYKIIIIHHSIYPLNFYYLPFHWLNFIKKSNAFKIMISQDEYRFIDLKCSLIKNLNINILFSTLSVQNIKKVYNQLRNIENFYAYSYTSGFFRAEKINFNIQEIKSRRIDIFYRGKTFGAEMGKVSKKKEFIGELVLKKLKNKNLNLNISNDEKRRDLKNWLKLNANSKATLLTFGGSEIFDFDGSIIHKIKDLRKKNLKEKLIYSKIKKITKTKNILNHTTITQRAFDAIKTKTAIITFEEEEKFFKKNNLKVIVIKKKDNFIRILKKINDHDYLQEIVNHNFKVLNNKKQFSLDFKIKKIHDIINYNYNIFKQQEIKQKKKSKKIISKKVLILYDKTQTYTATIQDYLISFKKYSINQIYYKHFDDYQNLNFNINFFDVVVIHYSYRINKTNLNNDLVKAFSSFKKRKVIFLQDEYEDKHILDKNIINLKPDLIFTTVPRNSLSKIYPKKKFKNIKFVNCLTGYLSEILLDSNDYIEYLISQERSISFFYRARELPIIYGQLGLLKFEIGKRVKKYLMKQKYFTSNIETDEKKRIYGNLWFKYLAQSKVMLGSESGSNVFDFHGKLKNIINHAFKKNKSTNYIYKKFVKKYEINNCMNQISPKIFEAIQSGCLLYLIDGNYSGVLKKNINYHPLNKNFSNIGDVLNLLNKKTLESIDMVARNYYTIALNDKYSYKNFIQKFDSYIKHKSANNSHLNKLDLKKNFITHNVKIYKENFFNTNSFFIIIFIYKVIKNFIPKKIKNLLKKFYIKYF